LDFIVELNYDKVVAIRGKFTRYTSIPRAAANACLLAHFHAPIGYKPTTQIFDSILFKQVTVIQLREYLPISYSWLS